MLTETLRRFQRQAKGPLAFVLPTGEEIDIRVKKSRTFLAQWIIRAFDGDEHTADRVASSLIPRAIRNAKAPWPYLVKALYNNAQEKPAFGGSAERSLGEAAKILVSRVGRCRLDLLQASVRQAQDTPLSIGPYVYDLSDSSDIAGVIDWLLGDDPYVLFSLLSPQYERRYLRHNGMQILVDDIVSARAIVEDFKDLKTRRATVLDFIKTVRGLSSFQNEFTDCLKTCHAFYRNILHGMHCLARLSRTRAYLPFSDLRDEMFERFRNASRRSPDRLKAAWLPYALTLGIVTNPLEWMLDVLEYNQTQDEWIVPGWYDVDRMSNDFGLRPVHVLFPELMVSNG